jgi:hypothetical protein
MIEKLQDFPPANGNARCPLIQGLRHIPPAALG